MAKTQGRGVRRDGKGKAARSKRVAIPLTSGDVAKWAKGEVETCTAQIAKVEKAIDVFPRSELIIEGHTDSFGGDDSNQKLSQQRAESVQQYMINAMRIPTYRLIATGYGETRPVASNETESGRERNRRIDIVIRPNIEAS